VRSPEKERWARAAPTVPHVVRLVRGPNTGTDDPLMAVFLLAYRIDTQPMGQVCQDGTINEKPISILYHCGPQRGF
jgi:hypothetical protein